MTDFTDVISDHAQPTIAYVRPPRPTWRERTEHRIERVRDAYDALWDIMPAIACFALLIWIITTQHR